MITAHAHRIWCTTGEFNSYRPNPVYDLLNIPCDICGEHAAAHLHMFGYASYANSTGVTTYDYNHNMFQPKIHAVIYLP